MSTITWNLSTSATWRTYAETHPIRKDLQKFLDADTREKLAAIDNHAVHAFVADSIFFANPAKFGSSPIALKIRNARAAWRLNPARNANSESRGTPCTSTACWIRGATGK